MPERVPPELRALLALLPMPFASGIALMLIVCATLMLSVSQGKVLPLTTLPRTVRHLFELRGACEWCGALLLHSDAKTWCCKSGQYVLDPLPPLLL